MKIENLINKNYEYLNENDIYIWNYIRFNRKECEKIAIDDLADRCHVSRSTILRFTKRLGLKGFTEFKVLLRMDNHSLKRGERNQDIYDDYISNIERMKEYNYEDICKAINNANNLMVYSTGEVQNNVASYLKRSFSMHRLLFIDMDSYSDIDSYIRMFNKEDVFVCISYSGENAMLLDIVYRLKTKGVKIIAIVANEDSTLSHISDYYLAINTVGLIARNGRYNLLGQYFILVDLLAVNYNDYINRVEL